MKKIIIHVGSPKTGTTSLQIFFKNNISKLDNLGISYPLEIRSRYVCKCENFLDDKFDKNLLNDFKNNEILLISNEDYWIHEDFVDLLKKLKDLGYDVYIIVYLRRQFDYLDSFFREWVKNCDISGCYFNFFEKNTDLCREQKIIKRSANYFNRLNEFSKVLTNDKIFIKIYDRASLKNKNIIDDFLDVLSEITKKDFSSLNVLVKDAGVSLTHSEMVVKSIINKNKGFSSRDRADFFRSARCIDEKDIDFFSEKEKKEIQKQYEDDNKKILEVFFNGKDKLFEDFSEDTTKISTSDIYNEVLKSSIRIFSYVLLDHFKRLNKIEEQQNNLLLEVFNKNEHLLWNRFRCRLLKHFTFGKIKKHYAKKLRKLKRL